MTQYSTTQTFPSTDGMYSGSARLASLVVNAGTGTVTLAAWDGVAFVDVEAAYTTDTVKVVEIANARFRVTPTGDAVYSWVA